MLGQQGGMNLPLAAVYEEGTGGVFCAFILKQGLFSANYAL